MKKIGFTLIMFLFSVNCFCQTYKIVGKGVSGQHNCSGTITEYKGIQRTISIYLSDMLNKTYNVSEKKQIDERTIQYKCYGNMEEGDFSDTYYIVKQKCDNSNSVYFFQFPPLYKGQGNVIYKTVIQSNGF